MEEVFTCLCGHQTWDIYSDRIGCPACGREYAAGEHDKALNTKSAGAFNANCAGLLIRGPR